MDYLEPLEFNLDIRDQSYRPTFWIRAYLKSFETTYICCFHPSPLYSTSLLLRILNIYQQDLPEEGLSENDPKITE
jgi:hypothetical protein